MTYTYTYISRLCPLQDITAVTLRHYEQTWNLRSPVTCKDVPALYQAPGHEIRWGSGGKAPGILNLSTR